mmetsp:Transcript_48979/g.104157  ORF Transcript_48979/g.104157 Transcript_48979/m.104157 type:complete len:200 (+) Transcript_48979:523-1122(+)
MMEGSGIARRRRWTLHAPRRGTFGIVLLVPLHELPHPDLERVLSQPEPAPAPELGRYLVLVDEPGQGPRGHLLPRHDLDGERRRLDLIDVLPGHADHERRPDCDDAAQAPGVVLGVEVPRALQVVQHVHGGDGGAHAADVHDDAVPVGDGVFLQVFLLGVGEGGELLLPRPAVVVVVGVQHRQYALQVGHVLHEVGVVE